MSDPLATTQNLLHPRQVSELSEEKASLEGMLRAPAYVRGQLQDGGAGVHKRIREIDQVLTQAPKPIPQAQLDEAVKLEAELRAKWTNGMPTHAEMRRNPSGAVDKHTAWDKRSKPFVLMWKHLRRRLHASGISDHGTANEQDVSNVEKFRPVGGSGELNMHNEQIQGAQYQLPPAGAARGVVMTEADEAILREHAPDTLDQIGLMDNETRAEVLDLARKLAEVMAAEGQAAQAEAAPKPKPAKKAAKPERKKPNISTAERARRSASMIARNAARKAAKKQAEQAEG